MADQKPSSNPNSDNPLFNMMDELLARHRHGAAAPMDDIPVLTDVAPKTIPSLFDVVDDIPALTDVVEPNLATKIANIELEWASDRHEPDIGHLDDEISNKRLKANSMEIPPLRFQGASAVNQAAAAPTAASTMHRQPLFTPAKAIEVPYLPTESSSTNKASTESNESIFLDLPMLDLDELSRAPSHEYLDLPQITSSSLRNSAEPAPIETFIATDLLLQLDDLSSEPITHNDDFSSALDQVAQTNTEITIPTFEEREPSSSELADTIIDLSHFEPELSEVSPAAMAETITAPATFSSAPPQAAHLEISSEIAPPADHQAAVTLNWDEEETLERNDELLLYSSAHHHESIAINLDNNTLHVNGLSRPQIAASAEPIAPKDTSNSAAALDDQAINSSIASVTEPSTAQYAPVSTDDTAIISSIAPQICTQKAQESIPSKLSEEQIAEITASVGAQLSLDIVTEVEKLARQHFDSMMAQFYSEALNSLTDQIMANLETQLAERITELVEGELRSKKLL